MYLCIYVSMYLCIYVSMYLCIYVSTSIYTYTYTVSAITYLSDTCIHPTSHASFMIYIHILLNTHDTHTHTLSLSQCIYTLFRVH